MYCQIVKRKGKLYVTCKKNPRHKARQGQFLFILFFEGMFRLMGHVLPEEKSIWIALTTIYGIGRERSRKILDQLKINYMKKVKDVTEEEQKLISDELKNYVLENDLKREVASAIKRLKEIKCYRGMRHNL